MDAGPVIAPEKKSSPNYWAESLPLAVSQYSLVWRILAQLHDTDYPQGPEFKQVVMCANPSLRLCLGPLKFHSDLVCLL